LPWSFKNRALHAVARRQNDFDERGIASSDKGDIRRAVQELSAQARV
jgi:hypothetical protein